MARALHNVRVMKTNNSLVMTTKNSSAFSSIDAEFLANVQGGCSGCADPECLPRRRIPKDRGGPYPVDNQPTANVAK